MPINHGIERGSRAGAGVGFPKESARNVVAKIYRAQFPNELIDIGLAAQMPEPFCLCDKLTELLSPMRLELGGVRANLALDVVPLEQRGRHRTAAAKAGSSRPPQPAVHNGGQPGKPLGGPHRGLDDNAIGSLGHLVEQFDLQLLLRSEMREQAAFRQARRGGELPQRHAGDAPNADLVKPDLQQALFGLVSLHIAK